MKFSLVLFTTLLSAVTALPSSPSNVEADVAVQHDIPPTEVAGGVTSADEPDTVSFSQSDSWEWGKRDGSEWSKRHADAELAKRALMTVVIYEDQDYRGRNEGLLSETGRCYNLGGTPTWNDKISSYWVEAGFRCTFFVDINCSGLYLGPYSGGVTWLGSTWNDKFSSYRCYVN